MTAPAPSITALDLRADARRALSMGTLDPDGRAAALAIALIWQAPTLPFNAGAWVHGGGI